MKKGPPLFSTLYGILEKEGKWGGPEYWWEEKKAEANSVEAMWPVPHGCVAHLPLTYKH